VLARVSVIGVSGNGKTTFSKRLARKLGVPHVELDAIAHQAGWRQVSADEMRTAVAQILASHDGWVIDGSYVRKLGELVFERADIIVWLDQSLPLVMKRLVTRALCDIVTGRELFNGNRQTWRSAFFMKDSLVRYALAEHGRRRRETPAYFAARPHLSFVRLRTPREVERFLAGAV
jgi:adenylate kinase family enzyme